jgi:hypothetical protein
MADSSINALILALIVGTLVFTACLIVFLFSRKLRSPGAEDFTANPTALNEHGLSLGSGITTAFQYSYTEMVHLFGKDTAAYQRINLYVVKLLAVLAFFGWVPLIVLYSQGQSKVNDDAEEISMRHVSSEADLLAGPALCLFVFSGVLYLFMSKVSQNTHYAVPEEADQLAYEPRNVVMVYGIPKQFAGEVHSQQILDFVREFNPKALSLYIVPEHSEAYALKAKLQDLREQQTSLRQRANITQQPDTKKIAYVDTQISELTQRFNRRIKVGSTLSSGYAFIAFESDEAAELFVRNWSTNDKDWKYHVHYWQISIAPNAEDLKWENFDVDRSFSRLKHVLLDVAFLLLFLVFLTPSAFLSYVDDLIDDIDEGVVGILNEFLPTMLILLYSIVLLPKGIATLVKWEHPVTRTDELYSTMHKYFLFLFFHVFVSPLIGLQIIEIIKQTADGQVDSWVDMLVARLHKSSKFFTIYMVHSCFLNNGLDLAALDRLVKVQSHKKLALTDIEKSHVYDASPFKLAKSYAHTLMQLLIAVTFSISYPLISTVGLISFSLQYVIHQYNIVFVYSHSKSTGVLTELALQCLTYATSGMQVLHRQFLTGSLLLLTAIPAYMAIGALSMSLSIGLLVFKRRLRPTVLLQSGQTRSLTEYVHPIDQKTAETMMTEFANETSKDL